MPQFFYYEAIFLTFTGLAVEIKIKILKYTGEGQNEDNMQPAMMTSSTLKKIFFEDVTLLTDEFSFQRTGHDINTSHADHDSDDEDDKESCNSNRSESEDIKPLKVGSLLGVQEMVLRFVDTDHFGLPRSVEEIEFNLGACIIHAYPHQIHTLVEILSALGTVYN